MFCVFELFGRCAHRVIVQPFAAQLMQHAGIAQLAAAPVKHGLRHALRVDEAFGLQRIQHRPQVFAILHVGGQFALQFQP